MQRRPPHVGQSQPTRTLPAGYRPAGAIDLSTNLPAQIGLSLMAVILFFVIGVGLIWLISILRPNLGPISGSIDLFGLLALIAATVAVTVIHELIHGLCFWALTRSRPHYGFKGLYAYAAAPDWYMPRGFYAITGAAPLVIISLVGMALALIAPPTSLPLLIYAIGMNAAGSIGDVIVVAWIAVSPRGALFRDEGDTVARFVPEG